ncbi:MAG: hypothetical protein CVU81_00220 [Euryarchaeota archaeon HGW-Euryarchaeota-1]|nr:MAG: hypothetical protein CVU81_00220 [Euryarchaeota archaeon HGW-Euryarchaeota-1]
METITKIHRGTKDYHSLARETRPELFGNEFEEKGHYFPNIQERLNALLNKHNGDLTSFQREVDAIYDWCKDPNNAEIIKKRGEKNKNYERDVFATEKIKEVVDNNNTQKIVVVRGAAHILYLQQLLWDVDVDANIQSALLNCDINKNSFYVPKTEITPSCWC